MSSRARQQELHLSKSDNREQTFPVALPRVPCPALGPLSGPSRLLGKYCVGERTAERLGKEDRLRITELKSKGAQKLSREKQ